MFFRTDKPIWTHLKWSTIIRTYHNFVYIYSLNFERTKKDIDFDTGSSGKLNK